MPDRPRNYWIRPLPIPRFQRGWPHSKPALTPRRSQTCAQSGLSAMQQKSLKRIWHPRAGRAFAYCHPLFEERESALATKMPSTRRMSSGCRDRMTTLVPHPVGAIRYQAVRIGCYNTGQNSELTAHLRDGAIASQLTLSGWTLPVLYFCNFPYITRGFWQTHEGPGNPTLGVAPWKNNELPTSTLRKSNSAQPSGATPKPIGKAVLEVAKAIVSLENCIRETGKNRHRTSPASGGTDRVECQYNRQRTQNSHSRAPSYC